MSLWAYKWGVWGKWANTAATILVPAEVCSFPLKVQLTIQESYLLISHFKELEWFLLKFMDTRSNSLRSLVVFVGQQGSHPRNLLLQFRNLWKRKQCNCENQINHRLAEWIILTHPLVTVSQSDCVKHILLKITKWKMVTMYNLV